MSSTLETTDNPPDVELSAAAVTDSDMKDDPTEELPSYAKPNREAAKAFFLSTLPRRIEDSWQPTGHRLAGVGVMYDFNGTSSVLYDFWGKSENLNEFGIGISLYFKTLKALFIVLLTCALISLVSISHNSNFNPDDTPTTLIGSTLGATREKLVMANQGASDIACCIVIIVFAVIARYVEKQSVEAIDVSQQTAQDYSVCITNPPENALKPDEYLNFFSQFGEVVMITVALNNGALIKAIADRKVYEGILQGLMLYADAKIENNGSITADKYEDLDLTFLQKIGYAQTIPKCLAKVKELTETINELEKQEFVAWKVYCTYNSEFSQRNCLLKTNIGKVSVLNNSSKNEALKLKGKTLDVMEAPEPGDIIFENSHVSFFRRFLSWCISGTVCFSILVASFFAITAVSQSGNVLVSIFISLTNAMLPLIIKVATQTMEIHDNRNTLQLSMLLKLVVARCVNTAVLIYVATNFEDTFTEDSLQKMQNILLADAFTTPCIRLFNIYDVVMRYVVTPQIARTQEEYNAAWQGAEWNLAERYTDMLKSIFVGLFFSVPLPSGLFITAFAMISTYIVDKYSLFNLWKRPNRIDASLGVLSRYVYVAIVFAHLTISRIYFANWPYHSEDEEAECDFFTCDTDEHMTADQKDVVEFYSGVSVTMFVVLCIWIFLYKTYKSGMKFFYGKMDEIGEPSNAPYRNVPGIAAYVPQVIRSKFISPLLCANVNNIPPEYCHIRPSSQWDLSVNASDCSAFNTEEFSPNVDSEEQMEKLFSQIKFYEEDPSNVNRHLQQQQPIQQQQYNQQQAPPHQFPRSGFTPVPTQHFVTGPNAALPPGWELKFAPDGRKYYVDHASKTTHWTLPATVSAQMRSPQQAMQIAPLPRIMAPTRNFSGVAHNANLAAVINAAPLLPVGWEVRHTKEGRIYYVDHTTRQTHWKLPSAGPQQAVRR